MAKIKIRHYIVRGSRAYWYPSKVAKARGWQIVSLGVDGHQAWAEAERLNLKWDADRKAIRTGGERLRPGTLAAVFATYRETTVWKRKADRTKQMWVEAWDVIAQVFADVPVAKIDFPQCDEFYQGLRETRSLHATHRVFQIFRALLNVAISMQLISSSPAKSVKNETPAPRSAIWAHDEVARLIEQAEAMNSPGIALAIRIAYDTQFSPPDVRSLTLAHLRKNAEGLPYFDRKRTKSKQQAYGTIGHETYAALRVYLATRPCGEDEPFLRTNRGLIFNKKSLAHDFRKVRNAVFPGDTRRLEDMRRSGIVEAAAGGATDTELAAKAGNTLDKVARLRETYNPAQLASAMGAERRREAGRVLLRESSK